MTLKHPLWVGLRAMLTQSPIPAKSLILNLFSLGIPLRLKAIKDMKEETTFKIDTGRSKRSKLPRNNHGQLEREFLAAVEESSFQHCEQLLVKFGKDLVWSEW